ncbi:MAG: hypothetical protein K8R53_13165 [Bacteroidales bacterium]|nr:hypothetical protein [Bacteroidales bacterium]
MGIVILSVLLVTVMVFIGLTRNELIDMLGVADYEDDYTINFYIGYSPKVFFNMDPDWLEIELTNERVSNARVRE